MNVEPGFKSNPTDEAGPLTIGELARRFDLNPSAIRYYERIGVLPEPARERGQRRYGPDTVRLLRILGVARRAGFSLEDAKVLLRAAGPGSPASVPLRELAARRLSDIEAHLAQVEAMRDWMLAAAGCTCEDLDVCALFDGAPAAPRAGLSALRGPAAVGGR
jgi:DNA-binding transcriptional MerR regulator